MELAAEVHEPKTRATSIFRTRKYLETTAITSWDCCIYSYPPRWSPSRSHALIRRCRLEGKQNVVRNRARIRRFTRARTTPFPQMRRSPKKYAPCTEPPQKGFRTISRAYPTCHFCIRARTNMRCSKVGSGGLSSRCNVLSV